MYRSAGRRGLSDLRLSCSTPTWAMSRHGRWTPIGLRWTVRPDRSTTSSPTEAFLSWKTKKTKEMKETRATRDQTSRASIPAKQSNEKTVKADFVDAVIPRNKEIKEPPRMMPARRRRTERSVDSTTLGSVEERVNRTASEPGSPGCELVAGPQERASTTVLDH